MKHFLRSISQPIKNFSYEIRARISSLPARIQYQVPYVCQFATAESAETSLKDGLSPANDPHWKETDASSPERYAQWAMTMCGMACTAMALNQLTGKNVKPIELAEDALTNGVYEETPNSLSSMRYREFAGWVKKHGLQADVYSRLSVKGIQYALSRSKLVIISVNPNIRGFNTAPVKQKGGHLVLATGYDREKGTISINNPSGFASTNTQVNHAVSLRDFMRFYAGRGIVLGQNPYAN